MKYACSTPAVHMDEVQEITLSVSMPSCHRSPIAVLLFSAPALRQAFRTISRFKLLCTEKRACSDYIFGCHRSDLAYIRRLMQFYEVAYESIMSPTSLNITFLLIRRRWTTCCRIQSSIWATEDVQAIVVTMKVVLTTYVSSSR